MTGPVEELAEALERLGLAEFLADFPGESADRRQWALGAGALEGTLRTTAGFLLLGEPAALDALPEALAAAVPAFVACGIAHEQGGEAQLADVSLFRSQGLWLVAEPPSPFPVRHYFGPDSVAMARRGTYRAGCRVLDLCSGPGLQGLLAASRGAAATLVELLPEAAAVARLNARLNGLTEQAEVLVGDLYGPLGADAGPYDRVLANIPFLPTVPVCGHPAPHEGGADGFAVGRRVLDGLPGHLGKAGTAFLTALLLEADGEPLLAGELRGWAAAEGYGLTVTVTDRMDVDADSDLVQTVVSDHLDNDPRADPAAVAADVAQEFARCGATAARLAYLRADEGMADFRVIDRGRA
ncbi:RsmD family RNA methyltransferase [Wenjunlia tyrosinilytica]|uniref:Methyltransferase small domain-containing protein n=1 Tax=Wenjunlia tyrosinilytica TaxID=1544741 RepID=A0A917ZG49_9ACTN|nr:RsmD family RNA methyltransferase [Wenjunlia tyrosinilytica]GGO82118.1 hypothetical protein GCM10012280_07940 [Wenjunlia tyrosinilytica]